MDKFIVSFYLLIILSFSQCTNVKEENSIESLDGFKGTPAWKFAERIQSGDLNGVKNEILADSSGLNAREKQNGMTLLMWSVKSSEYEIAQILLEGDANPDLKSNSGKTALFYATESPWGDVNNDPNPKFVELLLKYGADPNLVYTGDGTLIHYGTSPLIHASSRSLEKVKALVQGGAELNYQTNRNWTAANQALLNTKVSIAYYLIADKHAVITEPYYYHKLDSDSLDLSDPRYPVSLLKKWVFELGSEEHQKKMEIVEEFNRQGVDYWSVEPDKHTLEHIMKLYPDNWQEYLSKY